MFLSIHPPPPPPCPCFYSYFWLLLVQTRRLKCQDLLRGEYLSECHSEREGELAESTFPSILSFLHCQSPELSTLAGGGWRECLGEGGGQERFLCRRLLHRVVCFCHVANDRSGVGVFFFFPFAFQQLTAELLRQKKKEKRCRSVSGRKSWSESS